jgi:small subunit ribosomal protein S20
MANHASAKKKIRQIERRTEINRARLSRVRTFIKKVEAAILNGNQTEALEAFKAAQPEVMRGAQKGVMHSNTASRKLSRLAAGIKKLSA